MHVNWHVYILHVDKFGVQYPLVTIIIFYVNQNTAFISAAFYLHVNYLQTSIYQYIFS